jgi:uncharacterized protein
MPTPSFLVCVLAVVALACSRGGIADGGQPQADNADPSAEAYRSEPLPRGAVVLKDASGGAHRVEVEIAASRNTRTRGLMWRTFLASGHGMLFIFPDVQVRTFWMRNTLIPLDMIFLDSEATVVGIVSQAEPRTLSPRGTPRPSRYVLEVPGGWASAEGIRIGSPARFELPPNLKAEP